MLANLDASGGGVMSERVTFMLARRVGLVAARKAVAGAAESGGGLRDALAGALTEDELDEAFDPGTYLGSACEFVDAALTYYRGEAG